MSNENKLDQANAAKKMISETAVNGKPWRVIFIESYATLLAIRFRDFLIGQIDLTPRTIADAQSLAQRILDFVCQKRLDSVLMSAISAMTDSEKECVIWVALVKISQTYAPANNLVPTLIWNKDGRGYSLKFPEGMK